MTDQDAIRDDIAFMRTLAEEGRNGPLVGGAVMLTGGVLFGTASVAIWLGSRLGVANGWLQLAWPISGVLFFGALYGFLRRSPLPRSSAARGVGVAWSAIGWTMFVLIASLILMAIRFQDQRLLLAISPAILALYGCCWCIAAATSRRSWLYGVAIGAFAMALVTAWFALNSNLYLIYGISLYALAAVPGFVLMRQARDAAA